jgi:hypothetical protein
MEFSFTYHFGDNELLVEATVTPYQPATSTDPACGGDVEIGDVYLVGTDRSVEFNIYELVVETRPGGAVKYISLEDGIVETRTGGAVKYISLEDSIIAAAEGPALEAAA